MKTRVMLLINQLADGGAERMLSLWAQILCDGDCDVTVTTYYPLPNEYPIDSRITRANLFASLVAYSQCPCKTLTCKKLLEQYLTAHPQDLVLPFLTSANALAACCNQTHVKVLTPMIRNSPWDKERGYNLTLRDWAIQKQGSVILQNAEQREYFNTPAFKHVKKYVVHNPLNPAITQIKKENYQPIQKIVAVGRLVPQKNHALMIEAMRILRDEFHENYQLDIYGVGELQDQLQTQIDQAQLGNQVKLCGRNDEVFPILVAYDLFLMTSRYEGTPNALLEAMGLGLPALAINCRTGIRELIDDGKNGYIMQGYNAHDLANKIRSINNPKQLAEIGKQARTDMLTRYAPAKIQAELVATIQDLLSNQPKTVPLYPALKRLNTLIAKQPADVKNQYYYELFKTTLFQIKQSNYTDGKRLFTWVRKVLKNVAIDAQFTDPKLYQICLDNNNFDILYTFLQKK